MPDAITHRAGSEMGEPPSRRLAERISADHAIEYNVPGVRAGGKGRVLDLSESGIRFVAEDPIEPGTDVTIRFPPVRAGTPTLTRLARVVRCLPAGEDGFAIACTFD